MIGLGFITTIMRQCAFRLVEQNMSIKKEGKKWLVDLRLRG
ncbi:hypothetical protein L910_4035 [Vibrio fluvialis PG41]|uniref:Uncharacterized protein n=1 Tax=Vibrio fluvialis PG41 TaxID=1336752 RepID=S7I601_VIBFL|nr:hypothetical protein L910_4035 [Vibrio fluvialis PG41]